MRWTEENRKNLESALNEADVAGLRFDDATGSFEVLLHVLSLPPSGPLATDGRRVLRLISPAEIRLLLRPEPYVDQAAIPLADLSAVDSFFASIHWGDSMYGWRFFDDTTLVADWPSEPSLTLHVSSASAQHSFYWFKECGVGTDGEIVNFRIEGTVTFDDLVVLDAARKEIPLETFMADGVRQWNAFFSRDERLTQSAQAAAQLGAPSWRDAQTRTPRQSPPARGET